MGYVWLKACAYEYPNACMNVVRTGLRARCREGLDSVSHSAPDWGLEVSMNTLTSVCAMGLHWVVHSQTHTGE